MKDWESDWIGLGGYDASGDISPSMISDLTAWLSARQQGVERARREQIGTPNMNVLNAVEVNRVLDYAQHGLTRVINAVVPNVQPDLVSYSSYDSILQGTDPQSLTQALNLALNTINNLAPDPLGLGRRRVVISEYGLFENALPNHVAGADHSPDCKEGRLVGCISLERVRQ